MRKQGMVTIEWLDDIEIICDVCGYVEKIDRNHPTYFTEIWHEFKPNSELEPGKVLVLDICEECLKETLGQYFRPEGE